MTTKSGDRTRRKFPRKGRKAERQKGRLCLSAFLPSCLSWATSAGPDRQISAEIWAMRSKRSKGCVFFTAYVFAARRPFQEGIKKGLRATQRFRSPDFVVKSSRFRPTQNGSPKWVPAKGECHFFGPPQVMSLPGPKKQAFPLSRDPF